MPAAPYRGDSLESIQRAVTLIALRDDVLEPTRFMCARCNGRVIFEGHDTDLGVARMRAHMLKKHDVVVPAGRPRRSWALGSEGVEENAARARAAGSLVDYDDIRGDAA